MDAVDTSTTIDALRELIVESAPEPDQAIPVRTCDADAPLDAVIPFSSLMVLGTVVAIEHHFDISVSRRDVESAAEGGFTLRKLAAIIESRQSEHVQ